MKAEIRRCIYTETYNEIYQRMKNKYCQESETELDEKSDIAIRLKVLAGEIYNAQVNFEWLKNQMFADTASGEYLDYIAKQRGLERKKALKAQGEILFSISQAVDHNIIIPIGTVVATDDSSPIRFCTTEEGEISAGNTLVSLYAEAVNPGKSGNVKKNRATVGVSVPTEIETVKNPVDFSGGEDEETDNELRERIRSTFINQPNGTNKAYYENLALTVEGIAKASAVAKVRGAGTVNLYVCSSSGSAASSAIAKLQTIVNKERELNVDVKVYNAVSVSYDIAVTVTAKNGYSESEVKQACKTAFEKYINSIPIGGKFYLSELGKALLETECIENYEYDTGMQNKTLASSQRFKSGTEEIRVV